MIKTVGILGAGQLARMLAQAGRPMGLKFIFLDPARESCAAEFGEHICADWDDEVALRQLAQLSDVVTFEFEICYRMLLLIMSYFNIIKSLYHVY